MATLIVARGREEKVVDRKVEDEGVCDLPAWLCHQHGLGVRGS